jgi:hypothetical protein
MIILQYTSIVTMNYTKNASFAPSSVGGGEGLLQKGGHTEDGRGWDRLSIPFDAATYRC